MQQLDELKTDNVNFVIYLYILNENLKKNDITVVNSIKIGLLNFIHTFKEARKYKNIFTNTCCFLSEYPLVSFRILISDAQVKVMKPTNRRIYDTRS